MVNRIARPPREIGSFQDRKFRELLTKLNVDFGSVANLTILLLSASTALPNSRRLTGSSDIDLIDAGAGSTLSIKLSDTGIVPGSYSLITFDAKGRATVGATITTTDVPEGTHLYFTDARVLAALPQDIDTTDAPTFANLFLSNLTSGRVAIIGASGQILDDADLTFSTDTLSVSKLALKAGTSVGNIAKAGGAIFDHYADVGNGTTVETDLYSDTILANTFAADGDKISADYGGIFVSSATATRQIRVYFAGTLILDSGALSISVSASWSVSLLLIRVSATVVRYTVTLQTSGASLAVYNAVGELTALTLSNSNILKITGQAGGVGAATNDIVAKMGSVGWLSAA